MPSVCRVPTLRPLAAFSLESIVVKNKNLRMSVPLMDLPEEAKGEPLSLNQAARLFPSL
jgi:hypothetical protein